MIHAFCFLAGMFAGAVALCVALRIEVRRRSGAPVFQARELVNALKGESR